jgi:hydroxymethylbilane synthase
VSRAIRIGTRGSRLALTQTKWVRGELARLFPGRDTEIVTITTSGDRFLNQSLQAIGGKGLFVKEIEAALQDGSIDCAVHSMKDMPAELADGLVIAAVPVREDPRDVFISRDGVSLSALPAGSRLGTSSPRRGALLLAARPDLTVVPLRGNVETRLRKVTEANIEATVLAAAGLHRLGIEVVNGTPLDPQQFVPAVGQGALAIESRDDEMVEVLAALDHADTHVAVTAERAFLSTIGGSCHTPLAAHAALQGDRLKLDALIVSPDGARLVRGTREDRAQAAADIGAALANELLAGGGAAILQSLGGSAAPER